MLPTSVSTESSHQFYHLLQSYNLHIVITLSIVYPVYPVYLVSSTQYPSTEHPILSLCIHVSILIYNLVDPQYIQKLLFFNPNGTERNLFFYPRKDADAKTDHCISWSSGHCRQFHV